MSWGKGIVLSFVLFALFIGVLAAICIREEVPLVGADYYKQELLFQQQIDRVNNANQLPLKPVILSTGQFVEIQFNQAAEISGGELKLFRPSDETLDRHFKLNDGFHTKVLIDTEAMSRGMYKAQLRWFMNGKEYYIEQVIYL